LIAFDAVLHFDHCAGAVIEHAVLAKFEHRPDTALGGLERTPASEQLDRSIARSENRDDDKQQDE
jgi:hypothetical protein